MNANHTSPRRLLAVYLAGPISVGDKLDNIRRALLEGGRLRAAGYATFIPHRDVLDQLVAGPAAYEVLMAEDLEWVERCDVLVRLPGESPGADREVARAREIGRPVFHGVDDFLRAMEAQPVEPGPVMPSPEARRLLSMFNPWLRPAVKIDERSDG